MIDLSDNNHVIGMKWIRLGQSRPYADSVYEAVLTFTGKNISTKPEKTVIVCGSQPHEETVKAIARILVHDWSDDPSMCSAQLTLCRCEEKGEGFSRWRVSVLVPFTD